MKYSFTWDIRQYVLGTICKKIGILFLEDRYSNMDDLFDKWSENVLFWEISQ